MSDDSQQDNPAYVRHEHMVMAGDFIALTGFIPLPPGVVFLMSRF